MRKARDIRRWILSGGAVAAGLPAAPGLAWAIEGRPGASLLLAAAAATAAVTGILNAATAIYQARQETRRTEITCHSADALATALARCLDDAHAKAQNLSEAEEIEETARVRSSARQLLADMVPALAALLGQAVRSAEIRRHG